jgi:hypothetical protein
VSFSDRPNGWGLKKAGLLLLLFVLAFANLFLLMAWAMSFYDLDLVEAPRGLDAADLIIPIAWSISAGLLWLYHRIFMRDKN